MSATIYKSWPFQEAQKLQKRFKQPPTTPVRFETGFGPSGLPHIGTFAEVVRTTWVRHAFELFTGWPTELVAFSDDMDGLRKVPINMPNKEMLTENLGKPLCHIPDPFGECESYSAYMNNKLKEFLDAYHFEYHFQSSQEAYTRGDFNEGLSVILQKVDEINTLILPTMSAEKQQGWSPFFPICEQCGRIYSTRVIRYHPEDNTIDYACDRAEGLVKSCGHKGNVSVHNGHVKVGWKVDWALRWYSYEIGYEMYGKDLIESANLSGKITRIMGKQPPTGYFYELFLDEEGKKISKSVGKGLTIDTWVNYAPLESLLYYLFQNPRQAKRLYWGIVPKSVDEYLADLQAYPSLPAQKQPDAAAWQIFNKGANVPQYELSINFSLINNLISAVGTDDNEVILEYLKRYDPAADKYTDILRDLVHKGMNYYRDFILPNKHFRTPTNEERAMLQQVREKLVLYAGDNEDVLQSIPFEVAKANSVAPGDLFKMFYEVVLGQERGPRFGTFVRLVGKDRALTLLAEAIQRD
ncbi:lysyl-tRNA synthetase [Candidatus Vecturithrix granuli]|uniref:Lysine--tRNA ligase n=1 Tax=Vecturithrix granuli TaxID=1499967 RepID=A0A081BZW8_VECG1|nr:lysyl-tRNA synthetase [Candidatus Vecturithrix granuli]